MEPYLVQLAHSIAYSFVNGITGRLFTQKQIGDIAKSVISISFSPDAPDPADPTAAQERFDEARVHFAKANAIITDMQEELTQQSNKLGELHVEVATQKNLAAEYGRLAALSKEDSSAVRGAFEEAVRNGIAAEAEKGRTSRRIASAIWAVVTLVGGAWLGAYFKEIPSWPGL